MNKQTPEKIKEAFGRLSEASWRAIDEIEVPAKVKSLAAENRLDEDQTVLITEQVYYVLIGLINGEQFVHSIQEITKGKDLTALIVKKLNESIFKKYQEKRKEHQEILTDIAPDLTPPKKNKSDPASSQIKEKIFPTPPKKPNI